MFGQLHSFMYFQPIFGKTISGQRTYFQFRKSSLHGCIPDYAEAWMSDWMSDWIRADLNMRRNLTYCMYHASKASKVLPLSVFSKIESRYRSVNNISNRHKFRYNRILLILSFMKWTYIECRFFRFSIQAV